MMPAGHPVKDSSWPMTLLPPEYRHRLLALETCAKARGRWRYAPMVFTDQEQFRDSIGAVVAAKRPITADTEVAERTPGPILRKI